MKYTTVVRISRECDPSIAPQLYFVRHGNGIFRCIHHQIPRRLYLCRNKHIGMVHGYMVRKPNRTAGILMFLHPCHKFLPGRHIIRLRFRNGSHNHSRLLFRFSRRARLRWRLYIFCLLRNGMIIRNCMIIRNGIRHVLLHRRHNCVRP